MNPKVLLLATSLLLVTGCSKKKPEVGDVYEYLPTKERVEITGIMEGKNLLIALDTTTAIPSWRRQTTAQLIVKFSQIMDSLKPEDARQVWALYDGDRDSAFKLGCYLYDKTRIEQTKREDKAILDALKQSVVANEYYVATTAKPTPFDFRQYKLISEDKRYKKIN